MDGGCNNPPLPASFHCPKERPSAHAFLSGGADNLSLVLVQRAPSVPRVSAHRILTQRCVLPGERGIRDRSPGEEATYRVLLPVGRLHDGGNCGAFWLAQHREDSGLL